MFISTIRALGFTYLVIRTPILFMNGSQILSWVGAAGIFLFAWSLVKDIEQ